MTRVVVSVPGATPREIACDGSTLRIGRQPDCEIAIDSDAVSRHHALLRRSDEGWTIVDLGSRNGTFVNGARVGRATVRPGDQIRLGGEVMLDLQDEARDVRAPAPTPAPAPGRASWLRRSTFALVPSAGGTPVALARGASTVGRDAAARVKLDDDSVSRMHARLDVDGDVLHVTDLKSAGGTRVNGARVLRAVLHDGDVVTFGGAPFTVAHRTGMAWGRIGAVVATAAALVALGFGVFGLGDWLAERAALRDARTRVRAQAVASVRKGIAAFRAGDRDFARGYLLYAADALMLSDLAQPGASLEHPQPLFRAVARELPPEERDFDFAAALAPASTPPPPKVEALSNHDYVERQVRRIAIELGQDEHVPDGFVEQVWAYASECVAHPGSFQRMLDRSARVQPVLRDLMTAAHLPEVFCYVAWIESDLDPRATSAVGARGLWQFMVPTARLYGLEVDPARGVDERTDPVKSTRAATRYIGNLIRWFGREQFMCALASYNRGDAGVRRAMAHIPDPMMESSKKFWYLVEHGDLPRQTREYVPRILAVRILSEDPARFGFRPPAGAR